MKKIVAIALAIVLSVALVVPSSAASDTYMIFAAETDDGCGNHSVGFGVRWGPVGNNPTLGHPTPVEGSASYCVSTTGSALNLYHNTNWNTGVSTTGTFNATLYDYIELDIYSSNDVVVDWSFGLSTDVGDPQGASWGKTSAWLPAGRWTHVKMPISEFGGFPSQFPGNLNTINRIRLQVENISDRMAMEQGDFVTPEYTYIYFDNVIATKGSAGKDNELIDFFTLMVDPPEWIGEYNPPKPPPPPPEIVYGDLNGDGEIKPQDALLVLQHAVGKTKLETIAFTAADVNGDSEIKPQDALLVLQRAVGKIDIFPVEQKLA